MFCKQIIEQVVSTRSEHFLLGTSMYWPIFSSILSKYYGFYITVKVDNAFFLAGQIGLIPETMQIAQSFDSQSEHVVKHLNSVLQAFLPSDVQSLTDESPHSAVFVTIVFVTTLNSTTTVGFLNCWETFRFREV